MGRAGQRLRTELLDTAARVVRGEKADPERTSRELTAAARSRQALAAAAPGTTAPHPEQAAATDRAIHGLEDISVVVGVLILGPHRDPELAEAVSMATHALRSGAESAPASAPQAADTEADLLLAALTADALQLRRAGAALT
ncbi:hypothetical protein [Streptomyces sp. NPDC002346]